MKRLKILLFTATFIAASISSFAWWGQNGHRIVGEIADSYLSNKARKAIGEILGNESIAITSNWPDFIKSDSTFNYLSTCLLYTSDAADERSSVDLGGR